MYIVRFDSISNSFYVCEANSQGLSSNPDHAPVLLWKSCGLSMGLSVSSTTMGLKAMIAYVFVFPHQIVTLSAIPAYLYVSVARNSKYVT